MIVLFGSITSSMRIKKMLDKKGIKSQAIKTTLNPGKPDCGHAVKVDKKYLSEVDKAAAEAGIKVKGVFDEQSNIS